MKAMLLGEGEVHLDILLKVRDACSAMVLPTEDYLITSLRTELGL